MRPISQDAHTYNDELFDRIASSRKRVSSESRREAWIADTVLLVASRLGNQAVLSGGSAVRNITQVMRTTYDVDFDTRISSLQEVRGKLRDVNRAIGIKRKESKEIGECRENPERNAEKTFYGMRRMLHMLRRTDHGDLKVHIMHVPEMPEMFTSPSKLELVSIEKTDSYVINARAEHLFSRKTLRAITERRVEDFLDTYNLLHTGGASGRREIIEYARSKDSSAISKGLKTLAREPQYFAKELSSRLTYVEADLSQGRMKALAQSIAAELNKTADEVLE